jgi:CHASE2 domain-containing sensor protein/two-component sensor histidine kinase
VPKLRPIILGSLPSLAVIAGLLGLRGFGLLQGLEWQAFDQLMRWRPREAIDPRVVIIGIDESDLERLGSYPVSDRVLAQTIQAVEKHQPAAIGVDMFRTFAVPPGQQELQQTVNSLPNLFMAYRYTPDASGKIMAKTIVPSEQQGFVDVPLDPDGNLRRILLGLNDGSHDRISLPMQLASTISEQPPSYPFVAHQFGSYQGIDDGGDPIMLNPRNHPQPFQQFSLQDVQQGKLTRSAIQGKVVLIGLTAVSIKDTVNAMAVWNQKDSQVNGVEVQAHAVSQLVSAAIDHRPLIQSWSEAGEIAWIVGWGILGLLLGRLSRSPLQALVGIGVGLGGIFGICYGLLIWGWWVPLVPAVVVFFANASGFVAAKIYQREQDLRLRLRDRQQMLEQTFMAVHNGPLQDLAGLSRSIQDAGVENGEIVRGLQKINQELRGIFEAIQETLISDRPELYLGVGSRLNLQAPLHELLEQVYNETCARELAGVGMIQIKIVQFLPMDCGDLGVEHKQALCRFLEEALRNVGKHAGSATKLWVNCGCEGHQRLICVKDNGDRISGVVRSGAGTKQAKRLAKRLRGRFQRLPNQPQGMICRLVW